MKKLHFVTGNKDKVEEAKKILGIPIEIVDIDIDEIQSLNLEKIVRHKTEEAFRMVGKPLIVDDVSFEIEAWNGFPGPLVKFLQKAGNNSFELVLKMLGGERNKKVRIAAGIGYHDGKKTHFIEGVFFGEIVPKRGDNGWGFDPYVVPHGYTKTFGELAPEIKNEISHRARALRKLKRLLDSQK